jgi:hypothetical protein
VRKNAVIRDARSQIEFEFMFHHLCRCLNLL